MADEKVDNVENVESVNVRMAANGWVVTANGHNLDSDGDKIWASQDFVFEDLKKATEQVVTLMKTM